MFVLLIGRSEDYEEPVEQAFAELGVDWRLERAADATAALSCVQREAPDVVVSDLRPLGMEGTALIERMRAKAPKAAYIILLEEAESAQAMRALAHAHRILHKPLRAEELIEAIDGITDLRELLDSAELKAAIGRIDRLPPPPQLYLALSKAVADPDIALTELADLVAQDPGTAAKVLRICNSAFYSSGRAISSVRSAVIRLGQQELRRIVLASEVFGDAAGGIDREAMRQRALLASQLAGRITDNANAEMATTAALLAEVGMLLPGVWVPGLREGSDAQGPHYADAGAYLLGMWGLPMPIVEAVAHHCHPQRSRVRGFWIGAAVHVACALAAGRAVDEAYLESLGLSDRLPGWRQLAAELGAKQIESEEAQSPHGELSEAQKRQAAEELLASQPLLRFRKDGSDFLLLGTGIAGGASVEAIDAALLLHRYDALAIDRCNETLSAQTVERARLADVFRGLPGAKQLARAALSLSRQQLEAQLGAPVDAVLHEAIESAHRGKLAIWPLDMPLEQILQRLLQDQGLGQRWRLWQRCKRASSGREQISLEALAEGDPLALALESVLSGANARRVLFAEREAAMFARLCSEARQQRARRVLALVAVGHLPGLKRMARASGS